MKSIQFNDLPKAEKEKIIRKELDYLLAEGVVTKKGDRYYLKTQKQIEQEIKNIYNS